MNFNYDTIIVGGGPGGTMSAKILAKAGKKVALVSNELGGECLNYGCIPTKTYVWAAELLEKTTGLAELGIDAGTAKINWDQMKKRKNDVVAKLKKGLKWTIDKSGVKIFEGNGEIQDNHTVKVKLSDGKEETITSEFLIIATGSRSFCPDNLLGKAINSREILELQAVPKTLLIIGGGTIGVEFASIFSTLGTRVIIAEREDRILIHTDSDVSSEVEKIFARKGIEILKNFNVTPDKLNEFETTLVAIGRKPMIDEKAMQKLGVKFLPQGIETNEYMQTNVPNVFAVGDVAGKVCLAYIAEAEGKIAANFILGEKPTPLNYEAIPNTIFCMPEVAFVGIGETEAKKRKIDCTVGKSAYSSNAKALISGNRDGFVKIIVEKSTQKILGVHIVGEKATELIGEASLAITLGLTLPEFAKNLHSHPVLAEAIKDACERLN